MVCSGIAHTLRWYFFGNSSEFSSLISLDKTEWARCLLLPSLSGNMMGSPWPVNPADDVYRQLDSCLGPYCPDMTDEWPWMMSLMLMRCRRT